VKFNLFSSRITGHFAEVLRYVIAILTNGWNLSVA
jgi:hypothetical protein